VVQERPRGAVLHKAKETFLLILSFLPNAAVTADNPRQYMTP